MRDLTQIFEAAYAKSRNPHGTGMSRADDDYFDGDDPDKGDTWADDDIPDESPEEEREIVRREKASLDKALRQARADEGEDEDEAEDEAEDDSEADDPIVDPDGVGFDGEKFPDSRRGALLKNDSRQLRCGECGETNRVAPPKGYRFAKNLAGETEGGTGYKKVRWACCSCGEVNRGRVIANRASASEAIAAFRSRYSAEPHTPDASLDAVSTFRESYGMNNDVALWRECVRRHGG